MADTIREKMMQALESLLATVTGFSAEQVTRVPTDGPSESIHPRIDIVEGTDTEITAGDQKPNAKVSHFLTVELRIWIKGPELPATRLNNHMGEIEKVLRLQFRQPSLKLNNTCVNGLIPSRDGEVRRDAQFHRMTITLVLQYRHAIADPFSL